MRIASRFHARLTVSTRCLLRVATTQILRRLAAPIAFVALAAPATGAAQTTVARGWPLTPDGAVKIHGDAGIVRIIGWARDSVAVSATIPADVTLFGGGARTGVKFGVESVDGKPVVAEFIVHVPARARVWVRSVTANIDVSAFAGALDASTVAGLVHVVGTLKELRAESMNGALDVQASSAYLRLKTATGNVTWRGASDDAAVTTVSGRVSIDAASVNRARFESIDGEIHFSGGVATNANVEIDTHSGNVTLAFRRGTNLGLDVSAPGCELLGVPFGAARGVKATGPTRMYSKSIGAPALGGAAMAVRSYKGFVTATLQ